MHILKLNIIAAIIILLVKLLAIMLKGRVSARWKYFIWLFVAVSLLIPVHLPANFSLVDVRVQSYSTRGTAGVPDGMEGHTEAATEKMQQMSGTDTAGQDNGRLMNSQQVMMDGNVNGQKSAAVHITGRWMQIAAGIFVVVWLIVAVLKLAGEFLAYYLSMRNLRRMSLPVSNPVSIQIYRNVCKNKHVRKAPELRQNAGLTTPLLAGLFHTKLYLPATGYSAEERKLVFYHELTHYCHRDLWYKMLLRICATVYWFNPFLLMMLKEADKDIENLCDTAVIHHVNSKEHKLYRQLLLRTVAMDNQVPYVTASLNDSGMVFKDRILYMLNIRKLRRGILPGILVTVLLAGGNLAFNVSAGTDAVPVGTEQAGTDRRGNPEENSSPDYAQVSEMVDMQENAGTKGGQDGTEITATENVSQNAENSTENTDTETASAAGEENGTQAAETSASENGYDTDGTTSYYENLPAGVPYTSGFSGSSGVGSIVASGEGDDESRVLYDNGDGTYSDDNGFRYSYQGDGNWADANGNSYRTWNDSDYNSGTQLDQRELQGSNGTVDIKETTNGDYYYRDSNGVGYTDNGDGTWTDENGNTYTE
nr:M56 family metallopeptidase [Blautia sp. MSJ-19]